MANILYLGSNKEGTTSQHRSQTLRRLGHKVVIQNPYKEFQSVVESKFKGRVHYHSGYRFLQNRIEKWLDTLIKDIESPDLIWVNGGELFGKGCISALKKIGCPVVLYNNDDPTGGRDGRRFDSLLKAIPFYDLCAVLRKQNIQEYQKHGAENVLRVWMSYDEVVHKPFVSRSEISEKFKSDVAFIGTWIRGEGRGEFMLRLADAGVSVSIWGGRWEKSPHWSRLNKYHRGGALLGREYTAAMQGAKICIGLLSAGNRDKHTRRSVEIPYAGGLLCAERTAEHLQLYKEREEAIFWGDAQECAQKCRELLTDDERREQIRRAGMQRVRQLEVGNEDICRKILQELNRVSSIQIRT